MIASERVYSLSLRLFHAENFYRVARASAECHLPFFLPIRSSRFFSIFSFRRFEPNGSSVSVFSLSFFFFYLGKSSRS